MRLSLHVFTDASSRAYAAADYLRIEDTEGKVTVNLVASKCRLAPPSGDIIPRLELLGALLGARLLNSLRQEYHGILKIDDEFLWTASSVALTWINQGPRVVGVFVANRVEEIATVGGVWSWVPRNENPADLPTRGKTVAQLSASTQWMISFNLPTKFNISVSMRMMSLFHTMLQHSLQSSLSMKPFKSWPTKPSTTIGLTTLTISNSRKKTLLSY